MVTLVGNKFITKLVIALKMLLAINVICTGLLINN